MRVLKRRSSTKRELVKNSKQGKKLLYRKFSRSRKISESYCLDTATGRMKKSGKVSKKRTRKSGFRFNSTFNDSHSISRLGDNNNSKNYMSLGGGQKRKSSFSGKMKSRQNKTLKYKSKENYRKILNRYKRSKSISGGKKIEIPVGGKIYYEKARGKDKKNNEKIGKLMKSYKAKKYEECIELAEKILMTEPKNPDVLYVCGLSASMTEKHDLTIRYFSKLKKFFPKFKKNVFLFLSIANKKKGDLEEGIKILDQGILNFRKFYEAFLNRYSEAEISFMKSIKICDEKSSGFIGLADCYRLQNKFKEAIHYYSCAIDIDNSLFSVIGLKKAICEIEIEELDKAEENIKKILSINPNNCEAIYFKGLIHNILGKKPQAIELYEQVIKLNNSEIASLKSLHDITLIKIKQRNIYAAYYTLDRLDRIPEGMDYIKDLKIFLEAAVHMMKRKFNEGIDLLCSIKEDSQIDEKIKPLIHSYRAFGYFSLGRIEEALNDYNILDNDNLGSESDEYNSLLCNGILETRNRNFLKAKKCFEKSFEKNKKSVEPGFYLAMLEIEMNFNPGVMNSKIEKMNFHVIVEVIKKMEEILKKNDSSSNLYFQLGKLKLMAGLIPESLQCFDQAIEKSEDHVSDHFFWKGIALCMADNHEGSLGDFSTANEIEKENFKISKKENIVKYKLWIQKRCEMLSLYGKSFLHLKDYDNGVRIFEKIEKFKEEEFKEINDLKDEIKPIFEHFESKFNYNLANFFYLFGYNHEACKLYKNSILEYKEKSEFREEAMLWLTKCYVTEKNLVRALEMLELIKKEFPNPEYSFDYTIMTALKLTSSGDFNEAYSQLSDLIDFQGIIFKKSDVVFYSAVCLFYSGRFKEAKSHFIKAAEVKYLKVKNSDFENEALQRVMMEYLQFQSESEDQILPSCNQTFTKVEIYYNCALCDLKLKNFESASENFERLSYKNLEDEGFYGEDLIQNLTVFIAPSFKKIQELIKSKLEENIDAQEPGLFEVEIFPSENRLCGIYNQVVCEFSENVKVSLKLSFCLPYISLPDTSISIDLGQAKNLGIYQVENRPEAPWIKRNDNVIIFTENFIQDEAYYVEDIEELMMKMDGNFNKSAIRGNVEMIFERYQKEIVEKEKKIQENQIKTMKENLQLDMKTENILSTLLKEEKVDEDMEGRGSFFSQTPSQK